ncbi:MAG: hypothetical protein JWO61_94 [Candidatus Saccharibacteria bacterium]|nr:hypothetical protein [Candidatus Saccharibacteria bacterium]
MNQRATRQRHVISRLDVKQPVDRRWLVADRLPKYPPIQALPRRGHVSTLITTTLQHFEASRILSLRRSLEEIAKEGPYSTRTIATAHRLLEEGKEYALSYLLRDEE